MKSTYGSLAQDLAAKAFDTDVNLDETERLLSAVGGGALLLTTANLRSMRGLLATIVGASLLYRGFSGHCPMYSVLGVCTCTDGAKGHVGFSMRERPEATVA
jgi:uncharacterized membrane protein